MTNSEWNREESLTITKGQWEDLWNDWQKAESALLTVVSTLGPDGLCDCRPGDETCGLRDEAYYALQVARKALRLGASE